MFAPPAADAAVVELRLAQIAPQLRALIQRAGDALAANDLHGAQLALARSRAMSPSQPDVLRLHGLLLERIGNHDAAVRTFDAALRGAPDDAVTYWEYAHALEGAGDLDAALALRRRAIERLPESPLVWVDLGEHLYTYVNAEDSIAPLQRAVQLAPAFAPALLKLGSACIACGRAEEGARLVRQALEVDPAFAAAWVALVDIKTIPLTTTELERMQALLSDASPLLPGERIALEFALGLACERSGRYEEAWRALVHANTLRKRELSPWDVERFRRQERQVDVVFTGPHAQAADPSLGQEVLFIVGLPRSGTTLVEQVLASHPEVEGAGELAAMPAVLTEESSRRQQRYPEWVPDASAQDWQRLGERYLELTRGFRGRRTRSTDKLPNNWRALGAIRAMLPAAHVIICRRDPLENCWSCFKQYFPDGWAFTSDLEHLGLFWRAFDHAAEQWAKRAPDHVREQAYEALAAHPEDEIRALLDFCGLPFNAACLRPHELRRSVRTLSAAQVHEPIHPHQHTAAAYGALLDPLRAVLGIPALGAFAAEGSPGYSARLR